MSYDMRKSMGRYKEHRKGRVKVWYSKGGNPGLGGYIPDCCKKRRNTALRQLQADLIAEEIDDINVYRRRKSRTRIKVVYYWRAPTNKIK